MANNVQASVSRDAGTPTHQRAIQLQPYLSRTVPYWGHPGYFAGQQWRAVVKNQPVAIICRDTLISNMLSKDWSVRLREPEDTMLKATKKEIEHYTDIFTEADGDFDNHISLIMQDMLDMPFGGMSEIGREPDEKDGKAQWIEHVDGATLVPTADRNWPVVMAVPEIPSKPVVFPNHAISRVFMSPSPNIRRKGWGMAPPEKIYLAITMLFRGDRYYANLLLDTPEAGILDLGDMSQESATEWLEGFRSLFAGVDGFKVPVLYEHNQPAQWIPFNRPPIDLMYDSTTMKYAGIVAAGYGMRLSDIGMSELSGEKTLAGVIRGERQTRRTGQAEVSSKLNNYFNRILPKHLNFVWEEGDVEIKAENARALSTVGLALGQLRRDGLITPEEARLELVATGLMETDIDPSVIPEPEIPLGSGGQPQQGGGFGGGGGLFGRKPQQPPGKPSDRDRGKVSDDERGRVPPTQGGRGNVTMRTIESGIINPQQSFDHLITRLTSIVKPALDEIPRLASLTGARYAAISTPENPTPRAPRLRRLIKVVTRAMVPSVADTFRSMDDETIQDFWLPEMQALDFDMPSELDNLVIRQGAAELRELLEKSLEDDIWWKTASTWEKAEILAIFKEAYQMGLHDQAIDIVRALYEEGLVAAPLISPAISFELTNTATIRALETSAATMVANVNEGTKYFIKRIIVAGVRDVIAQPEMAQAIRDGAAAEELLRRDGFMQPAIDSILSGLVEMSEARAISIVNTELRKANTAGTLDQLKHTGLKTKAWRHLGARGVTKKGNEHPCPTCESNEKLNFVPMSFLFPTVFKKGGPENDGRAEGPPAHPQVCHCTVTFDEKELFEVVKRGEFAPYLGGR